MSSCRLRRRSSRGRGCARSSSVESRRSSSEAPPRICARVMRLRLASAGSPGAACGGARRLDGRLKRESAEVSGRQAVGLPLYNERSMQRDLRQLADTRFDVLVIGAGFYGVTTAWDAAQRGLSVAVIDQDDFGAATSFNNLKTLHGGLRSLQGLNFQQARLFIRERRALARIVPHLVRPLPFVIPTTRHPRRSKLLMRIGLAMNDAVARDRNHGLPDPGTHLPAGRIVSRDEALRLNPVVSPKGVTGGAVWYDYQMQSADRVTLSFLLSAIDAGASAANYVQVTRFLQEHDRVTGVMAHDRLTETRFPIRAAVVVNAAGPWAAGLLAGLPAAAQGAPPPALSRAMNVVTGKIVSDHACGGIANGRYLFMVPWRD